MLFFSVSDQSARQRQNQVYGVDGGCRYRRTAGQPGELKRQHKGTVVYSSQPVDVIFALVQVQTRIYFRYFLSCECRLTFVCSMLLMGTQKSLLQPNGLLIIERGYLRNFLHNDQSLSHPFSLSGNIDPLHQ